MQLRENVMGAITSLLSSPGCEDMYVCVYIYMCECPSGSIWPQPYLIHLILLILLLELRINRIK